VTPCPAQRARSAAARFHLRIGQADTADRNDYWTIPLFALPLILDADRTLAADARHLNHPRAACAQHRRIIVSSAATGDGRTLTLDRLKQVLHYDPESGLFTWLVRTSMRVQVGAVAGTPNFGYVRICIDDEAILAHCLAWFYMTGAWPTNEIDHINGVRNDNAFRNLREADRLLNSQNMRKARADNSTGLLGVRRMRERFQANIGVAGRSMNCGTFDTPEQAHTAYVSAKRRLHVGNTL
jgi:hypothetical protein